MTISESNLQSRAARFKVAVESWKQDANTQWRARTLTGQVLVQFGDEQALLKFVDGQLVDCNLTPPLLSRTLFTIRGTAAAWDALWQPVPKAGWHDLFALTKRKEVVLDGDLQQLFAHLRFVKDMLSCPRPQA